MKPAAWARTGRLAGWGLLLSGLVGCTGPKAGVEPAAAKESDYARLEQRLEALRVRWRVPGMAAAVARDGRVVWARGFGHADVAGHRAATPDTVFHLASLTKPFAATVLLQLVQEGRLDLDTPAADYGIVTTEAGVVRVRHLLTHTSQGVPGERFRYDGTRFGSLDKVLFGVTGRSFAVEVGDRILKPLGLTNTCPNPGNPQDCAEAGRDAVLFERRLARGYDSDGRTPVDYKTRFVTAAGLVSTVGDLAVFSAALDEDRLLGSRLREVMFAAPTNAAGRTLPYGMGWFLQESRGRRLAWHYGWWVGSSSLIIKVPGERLTFVLLANSDGLSRKFDLGREHDVRRSPFARAWLDALDK